MIRRKSKEVIRKNNEYIRQAWLDLFDELKNRSSERSNLRSTNDNGFVVDIRVEIPEDETDCLDDAYHIGYELVDCLVEENLDYNIYLNQIRRKR